MDTKKVARILKEQAKSLKLLGVYLAVILVVFSLALPVIHSRIQEQKALQAPAAAVPAFELDITAGAGTSQPAAPSAVAPVKSAAEATPRGRSPVATVSPAAAAAPADTASAASLNIDLRKMVWPIRGEVFRFVGISYSQTFSDYRHHDGLDIRAGMGSEAVAVLPGKAVQVVTTRGEAVKVVLDHGSGWRSVYAHLQESFLKAGDSVKAGQAVGLVGQPGLNETMEGPHLHFSLLKDGRPVNPLDYLPPQ